MLNRSATAVAVLLMIGFAQAEIKIYATAGDGVRYSTDDGATWSMLSGLSLWTNDIVGGNCSGLEDGELYVATTNGVYYRSAEGRWSTAGLQGSEIHEIEKSPNADYMLAVTKLGDVYRCDAPGESWSLVYSVPNYSRELSIVPEAPQAAYLLGDYSTGIARTAVFASVDSGVTWDVVHSWQTSLWSFHHCAAVHPDDPDVMGVGGYDGYLQTLDAGGNWTYTADSLAPGDAEYKDNEVTSQVRLVVAAWDAFYGCVPGIHYSDDYGTTWHRTALQDTIAMRVASNADIAYVYAMTKNSAGTACFFHKLSWPGLAVLTTSTYPVAGAPRRLLVDYIDGGDALMNHRTIPVGSSRADKRINVMAGSDRTRIAIAQTMVQGSKTRGARIVDAMGRIVKSIEGSHSPRGEMLYEWDHRDGQNIRVASGVYFLVVGEGVNTLCAKICVVR